MESSDSSDRGLFIALIALILAIVLGSAGYTLWTQQNTKTLAKPTAPDLSQVASQEQIATPQNATASATPAPDATALAHLQDVARQITDAARTNNWTFPAHATIPPGSVYTGAGLVGPWHDADPDHIHSDFGRIIILISRNPNYYLRANGAAEPFKSDTDLISALDADNQIRQQLQQPANPFKP